METINLVVLIIPFLAFSLYLISALKSKDWLNPHGFLLFVLFLLVLLKSADLFYGLEYEDAYIYQADSRLLVSNDSVESFRTVLESTYPDGSSQNQVYTGHFRTFSLTIGLVNKIFGYSIKSSIILNSVYSLLRLFVVFSLIFCITDNKNLALLGSLLLLSMPAFNLFGFSGLAETSSSTFLAITLLSFYKYVFKEDQKSLILFLIAFSAAIITKRENLYFLILFAFAAYATRFDSKLILSISVLLIAYFILVRPISTEFLESQELKAPTFSYTYIFPQVKAYFAAYTRFDYFFGIPIFTAAVTIIGLFKHPKSNLKTLSLLVFFVGFQILYFSHYRSRYFVELLEMDAFEALRYSNNLVWLLPIIASLALSEMFLRIKYLNKLGLILGVLVFLLSLKPFTNLNDNLAEEEYYNRIEPVKRSVEYIQNFSDSDTCFLMSDRFVICAMFKLDNVVLSNWNSDKLHTFNSGDFLLIGENTLETINKSEFDLVFCFRNNTNCYLLEKL
jgi:hypothetical protein